MKLDPAIAAVLDIDPNLASISSAGGGGTSSASTSLITTQLPSGDKQQQYFLKTACGSEAETMFAGEHASLSAIHAIVPTLCPLPLGHGRLAETPSKAFLVTDFLDRSVSHRRRLSPTATEAGSSLAEKLGKLHSTPAPTPSGYNRPQFGFPVTTCCGDTPQDNSYRASWAEFYANNRLRFITARARKANGKNRELEEMVERTCVEVVPRLLGDDHLNGGRGVVPVVVHGDLWSGNASIGKLPGMSEAQDVIFDASACYAHSEYELGIMKMFGGFGGKFLHDYHQLVPKTEPVEEYDDRVVLYELYHHLNHYAMFGGGYRSGALSIMRRLISKYGSDGRHDTK